ncbi:hypothetical protein GCM10007160_14290 [Litchfieldella qijiaojingensis]|uniref:Transposase n=1 Tax=Litchfieldella qijiaojingensis TaxID=980347 RepID=A0ABQ2YPD0_9GAMM|nr:hypothetical protein GCM10007160_14290 [Halomonas qijiaojingensis]
MIDVFHRQGWSLMRLRKQVLKVAATITVHARRMTVHIGTAADKWWPKALQLFYEFRLQMPHRDDGEALRGP